MAINMAQKRARKAQKRKLVVAQKRQAEAIENSLPARVLRASSAPIQHCLLTESLSEIGMGMLVLTRGVTRDYVTMSSFLLDTCCLGIKDVMVDRIDGEDFEDYMEAINADAPMVDVDPAYARKLLRDLAAWSQSIGFCSASRLRGDRADIRRRQCGCKRRRVRVRPRRQAGLYSRP